MFNEYNIEVCMTKSRQTPQKPYYWIIWGTTQDGVKANTGQFGWEKSPRRAWEAAFEAHQNMMYALAEEPAPDERVLRYGEVTFDKWEEGIEANEVDICEECLKKYGVDVRSRWVNSNYYIEGEDFCGVAGCLNTPDYTWTLLDENYSGV